MAKEAPARLTPEKIRSWVKGKGWDAREFNLGATSFDCKIIGALDEWDLLEELREALGLAPGFDFRMLIMNVTDEAIGASVLKMFTSLKREWVKQYRDKLFANVWYRHDESATGNWTRMTDDLENAVVHLRGGTLYVLFLRVFVCNFHDSFSLTE